MYKRVLSTKLWQYFLYNIIRKVYCVLNELSIYVSTLGRISTPKYDAVILFDKWRHIHIVCKCYERLFHRKCTNTAHLFLKSNTKNLRTESSPYYKNFLLPFMLAGK